MWHPHLKRDWIDENTYNIIDTKRNSQENFPIFLEIRNNIREKKEDSFLSTNTFLPQIINNNNNKMKCVCKFIKENKNFVQEEKQTLSIKPSPKKSKGIGINNNINNNNNKGKTIQHKFLRENNNDVLEKENNNKIGFDKSNSNNNVINKMNSNTNKINIIEDKNQDSVNKLKFENVNVKDFIDKSNLNNNNFFNKERFNGNSDVVNLLQKNYNTRTFNSNYNKFSNHYLICILMFY